MMAGKEIEHGVHPGRPQTRWRRDQVDAEWRRPPVDQNLLQFARCKRVPDNEIGQPGNADAGTQRGQHRLSAVDRQPGAHLHHDILLAGAGKAPDVGRRVLE